MTETLSASRWDQLAARLRLTQPVELFRRLSKHYASHGRRYHTAEHVNDCLVILDRTKNPEAANPLVEYALWFHDAIYSSFSKKNEDRSADWAALALARSGATLEHVKAVRAMIVATRYGETPAAPASRLVADVDRAILGARAERYKEYELQLRAEHWWVPTALYRRQRSTVLGSFLLQPSIYLTEEFQDRYEREARENIAWTLDQMTARTGTFRWTRRL